MMSRGASSEIMAISSCSAVRLCTRERARSSSRPRGRQPAFGPDPTVAGFAPMKAGPVTVSSFDGEEKLSDRWWPSKRHAQGPPELGVPKMVT